MARRSENHFVNEVRQQAERARRGRDLSFWEGLSLVGAVGWMVIVPALMGVFIGRWLDQRFSQGVFWTLSLLVSGVALGCLSASRHIREQLK